jgi:hypothetical protein
MGGFPDLQDKLLALSYNYLPAVPELLIFKEIEKWLIIRRKD